MRSREESKNLTFSEQWGEYFENPADYPIWNYLLQHHRERFDGNYMEALFIELRNKFALLGVAVESKSSGVKYDNKKSEEEFFVPANLPNYIEKFKNKLIAKSAELFHFQIKNFKISQIKAMLDKEMLQFADSMISDIESEPTEEVLSFLKYFLTQNKKELAIAELNQFELFQQLIEKVISAYKKHKLNNEMEIFFDRNPRKIKVLDGIDEIDHKKSHERYVCNFIFLIQQYFINNLDKIKSADVDFDVYCKQEDVLRFVKQVLHLLDRKDLMRECEQAVYYVMTEDCNLDSVKRAHIRGNSIQSITMPVPKIEMPFETHTQEPNIKGLKTALYVACGVLVGVAIIGAFVFGGGLPLLMGFLAIHLIYVAPLLVKLGLVVAGVVIGGGLGFGSKKIADVAKTCGKEEVSELEELPVVYKKPEKKVGKRVHFEDHPSPSNKGIFLHKSTSQALETNLMLHKKI